MKSLHSKSRLTKSIVRTGVIVTSLALAGNAFAANTKHVAAKAAPHHVVHHAAATTHRQVVWQRPAFPFFAGLFGLPLSAPVTVHARHSTHGSADSSGGYDPTFDTPSATVEIDNSASDEAAAAAAAASEQNLNDSMALTASMAAAEQQNDAANAAMVQEDVNAGM